MTSRLSKNRQTTRPNTRRWNKLKAVVVAAGVSVLLNLPSTAPADEPPAANRPSVDNGSARPAAERWKRLKSQYDVSPTPTNRLPQIEQPTRTSDASAGSVTIRSIPDDKSAEFGPIQAVQTVPVKTTAVKSTAVKTTAVPAARKEPELEWKLPTPMTDDELPEGSSAEEIPAQPEKESSAKAVKKSEVPADDDPAYEGKVKGKGPAEFVPADRGTRRPITPQIPEGPPLKATQVRRIGDIAPLNDFDRDTEIKKYAAEKAREFNVRFGGEQYIPRSFPEVVVPWTAPTSKYYPLYFQDPALERYGHTYHPLVQPAVSSAKFAAQLVLMPYQMTIDPPWELSSPLGWYRPGDVVPKLHYPFPWNAKAAAVEAVTVTGLIFLIQ